MEQKNNIQEITYIKGIAILLVFIGHAATPSFLPRPYYYELMVQFIYSIHMPLFFLISGFLSIKIMNMNLKKEYLPYVKGKLCRLAIPFLTISIITNFLIININKIIKQPLSNEELFQMFKTVFLFPENGLMGALWFLYVLLIISIVAPLIIKLPLSITIVVTLALNIFMPKDIHFLAISRVSFFLIYFVIGLTFRKYYTSNRNISIYKKMFIGFTSMAIISIHTIIITNQISVNRYIFNSLTFICGLLGMVTIFMFIGKVKNKTVCKILECLGKYSMDIYIFSWFFQVTSMILITNILKIDNYNIFFIFNISIGILCLPFSKYIIRKVNIFKFIFLGITTKKTKRYKNSLA